MRYVTGCNSVVEILSHQQQQAAGGRRDAAVLLGLQPYREGEGARLLLTRRPWHLKQHAGQIALPGGKVEPAESIVDAAVREAHEETALPLTAVEPLSKLKPFDSVRSPFVVTPVIGWIDPGIDDHQLVPADGEVDEIFWADLRRLMHPEIHRPAIVTGDDGEHVIDYFHYPHPDGKERTIWGLTGVVLRNFFATVFDLDLPRR